MIINKKKSESDKESEIEKDENKEEIAIKRKDPTKLNNNNITIPDISNQTQSLKSKGDNYTFEKPKDDNNIESELTNKKEEEINNKTNEKGSGIRNDSKKNKKSKNAKKNSQDENDMEEETFDETDLKFIDAELPRVIVFVFDPKTGHTYGVALDQNGEKIDLFDHIICEIVTTFFNY